MILPEQPTGEGKSGPDLYIASIGKAGLKKGAQLCKNLRRKGNFVIMDFEGKSLQAQMRMANREGAHFVLFMGDDEIREGQYTLRNMRTGEQKTIQDKDIERFKEAFDA